MGNSYTRQSAADIVAGLEIQAGPLNAEFNQLQSAFDASAGHSHDGSTGEGPKISLTTSVQGILPIVNGGFGGIHNLTATTAPLSTDDNLEGYVVGSIWIDTTANVFYVCVDSSTGAAIWNRSQAYNTNLSAIAGLTSASNKGITFSGVGTAATYDLSTFALTLLDDTTQAAMRTTLGLTPGTDVQAYDATLAALAAFNSNGILVQTAADTFTSRTLTGPANGISVTNGDGVSGNPTLALSNDLAALEALSGTDTIYYRSGTDTWTAVTIGTNLGFSGGVLSNTYSAASLDADLQAIAALSGTGFAVRTAADTWAQRSLTAPATGITISNNDGVSGNPTFALANDLSALEGLSSTGISVRTATDTWAVRSVAAGTGISMSNGDGVSGNPTVAIDTTVVAKLAGNQTFTGGFKITPYSIGTVTTGTTTPDPTNGNYQYYTNNGAHTLAVPSNDCAIDILITNGASAGSITFSGFTVASGNTGDALTTTSTNKFILSIRVINSIGTYTIKALQ